MVNIFARTNENRDALKVRDQLQFIIADWAQTYGKRYEDNDRKMYGDKYLVTAFHNSHAKNITVFNANHPRYVLK